MRDIAPTILKVSEHQKDINRLIEESKILETHPKLDKYLCMVLISELLFRSKRLVGQSWHVNAIRSHEEKFRKLLENPAGTAETENAEQSNKGKIINKFR